MLRPAASLVLLVGLVLGGPQRALAQESGQAFAEFQAICISTGGDPDRAARVAEERGWIRSRSGALTGTGEGTSIDTALLSEMGILFIGSERRNRETARTCSLLSSSSVGAMNASVSQWLADSASFTEDDGATIWPLTIADGEPSASGQPVVISVHASNALGEPLTTIILAVPDFDQ